MFNQLDVTKRKRITHDEFVNGIKALFAQEGLEISDLGLEMLWDQMAKDETGKVSWSEFSMRFVADPTTQFTLAEKPKTEEELKAELAPKKIASSDIKKIQEMLYLALKKWRYLNVDLGLSPEAKSYSKAELRQAFLTLCAAERYEADYIGRPAEPWSVYMSLNDLDLEKLFGFASWTKSGAAKASEFLPALERLMPAARRTPPDAAKLEALAQIPGMVGAEAREAKENQACGANDTRTAQASGDASANGSGAASEDPECGLSASLLAPQEAASNAAAAVVQGILKSGAIPPLPDGMLASSLRDAPEFKTVPNERLGVWILENLLNTMNGLTWMNSLRAMKTTPYQGPLLVFPPAMHWISPTHDSYLRRAVLSIEDPQVVQGCLIVLSDSIVISGIKVLPVSLPGNASGFVYVVYAQFLYVCQVTKPRDPSLPPDVEDEASVIQWLMRAKLYVTSDERPLHMFIEDSAVSVNTESYVVPPSKYFADWDFPSIEFSLLD